MPPSAAQMFFTTNATAYRRSRRSVGKRCWSAWTARVQLRCVVFHANVSISISVSYYLLPCSKVVNAS